MPVTTKNFNAGIRFVGGPWHNRIVPVRALSSIRVPICGVDVGSVDHHYTYDEHVYFLTKFLSDRNAVYWQYVYQPLAEPLRRGENKWISTEFFPNANWYDWPLVFEHRLDDLIARWGRVR